MDYVCLVRQKKSLTGDNYVTLLHGHAHHVCIMFPYSTKQWWYFPVGYCTMISGPGCQVLVWETFQQMTSLPRSLDMNWIEHLWDVVGKYILTQDLATTNTSECNQLLTFQHITKNHLTTYGIDATSGFCRNSAGVSSTQD